MEFYDSIEATKASLLILLLLFCCVTDLSMRRIPNAVLLPALVAALFLNSLAGGLAGLADSVAGLAIGLLMLMPLYVLGQMGAGDLKLLGVVGSTLGAWGAVVAGLATMMAGGLLGIAYMFWIFIRPEVNSWMSNFGRLATGQTEAPGDAMSLQTLRTAEIPYALAITAGTFAALTILPVNGVSIT